MVCINPGTPRNCTRQGGWRGGGDRAEGECAKAILMKGDAATVGCHTHAAPSMETKSLRHSLISAASSSYQTCCKPDTTMDAALGKAHPPVTATQMRSMGEKAGRCKLGRIRSIQANLSGRMNEDAIEDTRHPSFSDSIPASSMQCRRPSTQLVTTATPFDRTDSIMPVKHLRLSVKALPLRHRMPSVISVLALASISERRRKARSG